MEVTMSPRWATWHRIRRTRGLPVAVLAALLLPVAWPLFKLYDVLKLGEPANPRTLKVVEWSGSILGLSGAWLVALNSDVSGYGFLAFLVSNGCWLWYGLKTRTWGLTVMQIGFTGSSILGIHNWLI